jgi:hypothetical protein
MAKRPANAMFDPDLLARIDADRRAKGQSRSEWLARAAELALFDPDGTDPAQAITDALASAIVRKPADPAQTIADNLARTGPAFEKVAAARKASRSDPDVQPIPKGKAR